MSWKTKEAKKRCDRCGDVGSHYIHTNGAPNDVHEMVPCVDCDTGVFLGVKKEIPVTVKQQKLTSPSNSKLGKILNTSLPQGDASKGGGCPVTTGGCEGCYVQKYDTMYKNRSTGKTLRETYSGHLDKLRDDPAAYEQQMHDEISTAKKSKSFNGLMRIHVSGDLQHAEHAEMWGRLADKHPDIKFWGTTRSGWLTDDEKFKTATKSLRDRPNVALWASEDWDTEARGKVPEKGWQRAKMFQGDTYDDDGKQLTGHRDVHESAKKAASQGFKACPHIMGQQDKEGKKITCDSCKRCFNKKIPTVAFPVH